MPKKYKFLIYLGVFFLVVVIGYVIVNNLSSPASKAPETANNPGNSASSTIPDLILTDDQEAWVKQFVKNFVNLYNTYSYSDYSNLTALGDYQTQEMQQKTLSLVEQLKIITPVGFSVATVVDESSFTYRYPDANQLLVTVQGQATESNNSYSVANAVHKITASLSLEKSGNYWVVSDIKIIKNN